MADEEAALEGFFAKKDKTKNPKKKKKTKTSETIIKETDQQTQQVDEWKDFEEEKEKDYSNLKIADLQVNDENSKEQEEEKNEDYVDGENQDDDSNGIWKTSNAVQPPPQQTAQPEIVGTQNVVGGKYVPPSLKRATLAAASKPVSRRRQGAPPDIQSQAAFPSLAAASEDSNKMSADFEVVKGGMRTNEARVDDKPKLEIENRYDGLRS